jgi:succinoglycan biosynthesis transport protein ExoP
VGIRLADLDAKVQMLSRTLQPATPAGPAGSPDASVDGIVQSIWRHKSVVVLSCFVALVSGLIYVARAVPMYPSYSRLLFDGTRAKILGEETSTITDSYLHARCELIESQPILESAAVALETTAADSKGKRLHSFLYPAISPAAGAATIRQGLDVSVGKDDQILTVSFVSPSALDSQAVVEAVVHAYIQFEKDHHKDKANAAFKALVDQQTSINQLVATCQQKVADFQAANPGVESVQSNPNGTQRSKIEEAYDNARGATVQAKTAFDSFVAARPNSVNPPMPDLTVDTDLSSSAVASELAAAELNMGREIRRGASDSNPTIIAEKLYISKLRHQLEVVQGREESATCARLKGEYENDRLLEANYKKIIDEDDAGSRTARAKQNQLALLTADLNHNKASSDAIGDKIKDLKPQQNAELEVDVIDAATLATRPDGAKSRVLGMAAILGLLVGVGLALGLDVLDNRLRSPEDARNLLGLPILGVVPHQQGKLSSAACGLIAHADPMSEVAEAARSVRTAVYFASRTTPVRTVLIASPSKGDGKSVFASNLAIAMAQAGSRTLLIDADFRNPSQEQIFDVQTGTGLSEVLIGRCTVEKAIRRTPIEGLEVLPCGPIPRNPSEMLNNQAFSKLIEQLSERYQCILLDSPPAMSVTDARILGAMADVTLYVVRTGQTSRKAADQGLDLLLSVGSRVLGAVVNDVATRAPRRNRSSIRLWDGFQSAATMGTTVHGMRSHSAEDGQIAGSLAMGQKNHTSVNHASSASDLPEVDVLD